MNKIDRRTVVEDWLRTEVAQTYDRLMAGDEPLTPAEDVFSALKARHRSAQSK